MANSSLQQHSEQARVVGHIDIPQATQFPGNNPQHDDFLSEQAASPWQNDNLQRKLDRLKAEISELRNENRWQDILVLLHPVAEKWPELCKAGLHSDLIREAAFTLCRAGKYEEAISTVKPLTVSEPDNTMAWYNLGYSAYEALYSRKRDRKTTTPAERKKLIDTAHKAFARCQQLRPDSITFFYREGMVYKDFENKPARAIPLFEHAIENYEQMNQHERENSHQQRPKYIRAMYHLASCLLQTNHPDKAETLLQKVLSEDNSRNYMSPLFKHFAMAKTLFSLGRAREALDHLQTAAIRADKRENLDYVHELAARCALILGRTELAVTHINRIPEKRRRPYIQWTRADVLIAGGRNQEALKLLEKEAERDRRSRHKSLLRIARIHLTRGDYKKGLEAAGKADIFCQETYGNGSNEAKFWQAACLFRMGHYDKAEEITNELSRCNFSFPNFRKLVTLIHEKKELIMNNYGQNTLSRVK